MPSYRAVGVTASLSISSLQDTLLPKGTDTPAVRAYTEKVFARGISLRERPIGADGGDKGVMQFIGKDEDMPLFLVEAGELVNRKSREVEQPQRSETPATPTPFPRLPIDSSLSSLPESPLTSLGPTPVLGTPSHGFPAPSPGLFKRDSFIQDKLGRAALQPVPDYSKVNALKAGPPDVQALMLAVETNISSYLPDPGVRPKQNMKIEVFMNGQLVNMEFFNPRRGLPAAGKDTLERSHFSGTRVSNTHEKPWVYQNSDISSNSMVTAQKRWRGIAELLRDEAHERGTNKFGVRPCSAEYLMALSVLLLPERFLDKPNFGIMDIVITTGNGRKYDPGAGLCNRTTRMESTVFKIDNPVPQEDYPLPQEEVSQDSPLSKSLIKKLGSSLGNTLYSQRPFLHDLRLDTSKFLRGAMPKKTPDAGIVAFAKLHGLDTSLDRMVANRKNRRGKPGTTRTVYHRLIDIAKMNDDNRFEPMQEIVEQLEKQDDEHAAALNLASLQDLRYLVPTRDNATGMQLGDDTAMGPVTTLAQARMDLAMDSGASQNGRLAQRIASRSPLRSPTMRARAVVQTSPAVFPRTRPKRKAQSSDISSDTATTHTTPKRRRVTADKPAFEPTYLCEGSSLSYATDDVLRQTVQARPGKFEEEKLVVGMRFVVV